MAGIAWFERDETGIAEIGRIRSAWRTNCTCCGSNGSSSRQASKEKRFATVFGDELVVVVIATMDVYQDWCQGGRVEGPSLRAGRWAPFERESTWMDNQVRIVGAGNAQPASVQEPFGVWTWNLRHGGWKKITDMPDVGSVLPVFQQLNGKSWHYAVADDEHMWLFTAPNESSGVESNEFLGAVLTLDIKEFGCKQAESSSMSMDLSNMLGNPEFSDFTIIAQDVPFPVHCALLITRWPHFGTLLKSGTKESTERTLYLPESPQAVKAFLFFIYTDQLATFLTIQQVSELLNMGHMYNLDRLVHLCVNLLADSITVNSVACVWECAERIGNEGLVLQCMRYMMSHWGKVVTTDAWLALEPSAWKRWWASLPSDTVLTTNKVQD